jgi:phenylpyruvate tautomerase PptA (4-oxalocrotonate tautomerase family)
MPLWQVFHPKDTYSAEDKHGLAERITGLFTSSPMPAFYVVVIYIEVGPDDYYVGGEKLKKTFIRFKVDQMANTFANQMLKEWWMRHVQRAVAPYVSERGYDSEIQIDEPGRDMWNINGLAPPPFGSVGELRWIKDNHVSPYTEDEKLPHNSSYAKRL